MIAALKARLKGFRSLIGAGFVGAVGALQIFGAVDITPVLRLFVKDDNMIGVIMVGLAIGAALMRFVTNTPVGQSVAPVVQVAPVRKNVDDGA